MPAAASAERTAPATAATADSDMPRILQLVKAGKLPIDKLISRRYRLEEVNEAFAALVAGEVARSVLIPDRLSR
jgi:Zn-dependent alcohol dehydrogenase